MRHATKLRDRGSGEAAGDTTLEAGEEAAQLGVRGGSLGVVEPRPRFGGPAGLEEAAAKPGEAARLKRRAETEGEGGLVVRDRLCLAAVVVVEEAEPVVRERGGTDGCRLTGGAF